MTLSSDLVDLCEEVSLIKNRDDIKYRRDLKNIGEGVSRLAYLPKNTNKYIIKHSDDLGPNRLEYIISKLFQSPLFAETFYISKNSRCIIQRYYPRLVFEEIDTNIRAEDLFIEVFEKFLDFEDLLGIFLTDMHFANIALFGRNNSVKIIDYGYECPDKMFDRKFNVETFIKRKRKLISNIILPSVRFKEDHIVIDNNGQKIILPQTIKSDEEYTSLRAHILDNVFHIYG